MMKLTEKIILPMTLATGITAIAGGCDTNCLQKITGRTFAIETIEKALKELKDETVQRIRGEICMEIWERLAWETEQIGILQKMCANPETAKMVNDKITALKQKARQAGCLINDDKETPLPEATL